MLGSCVYCRVAGLVERHVLSFQQTVFNELAFLIVGYEGESFHEFTSASDVQ